MLSGDIVAGVNVGSSEAWYAVTVGSTVSSFTLNLTGTTFNGDPAGSDVMNIYSDCAGAVVVSDVTSYTGTASGSYWIEVTEESGGSDGAFTLAFSTS